MSIKESSTILTDMEPLSAPFTGWYVHERYTTYNLAQRIGLSVYRWGVAHVYDDGLNVIIVRQGDRGSYSGPGYYMEIPTMAGNPGQHFSNVHAALAEADRVVRGFKAGVQS